MGAGVGRGCWTPPAPTCGPTGRTSPRWAHTAGRVRADPTARVRPVAEQPLAPKGFSALERRR
ncbi:MAG TPA: hypothetical protein VHQ00_01850, partial [Chloroflexota bacterium]|nr:hypothetical protein [Chloroflexota bacterium]